MTRKEERKKREKKKQARKDSSRKEKQKPDSLLDRKREDLVYRFFPPDKLFRVGFLQGWNIEVVLCFLFLHVTYHMRWDI